jgi:hypothetical protein
MFCALGIGWMLLAGPGRQAAVAQAPRAAVPFKPSASSLAAETGPTTVKVGVYVLSVGNLDMTSGGYTLDFYLNFTCDRPCNPTSFDIMNAASAPEVDDQTADTKGDTFFTYRVRANLITNLDLKRYPFDEHNLVVEIEDKSQDATRLVYDVDPVRTGIDEHVLVSGWDLRHQWKAEVLDHIYPVFENSNYSRYRFYVSIYHPWQASFLKGIFAAIVIIGVGMLSFLLAYDDVEDRLNLASGTLASAIFYHMTLTSSIPPVGYLTFADRFMLLQYLIISLVLAVSIALMILINKDNHAQAKRLHLLTRWAVPLVWIAAMFFSLYWLK